MRFLLLVLTLCLTFTAPRVQDNHADLQGAEPQVVDAVEGILAAFDEYPVVAIGEQHGISELGDLYQALLRDPHFPQTVDAVVLEYGNALYQNLIDRYMNGEQVPAAELRRVWNDAVGRIPGGTEVMYAQLFTTLRAINQTLPEGERIRVLLGDPPLDWSTVQSRDDVLPVQLQRENHFANVVIHEVLDKGLKALVIIGGPHLDRSPATPPPTPSAPPPDGATMMMLPPQAGVMQQLVEAAYPGQTFVILVHTGFVEDECNAEIEARLEGWQTPALASVPGTWLQNINCTKFPAAIMITQPNAAGNQLVGAPNVITQPMLPNMIAQADAYLYVGNRDSLTMSPFDPEIYLDWDYFQEVSRRRQIMSGAPLDWAEVARDNPRRYVDNFPVP